MRNSFCRLLSDYKKVDCPGISLKNMPSIDDSAMSRQQAKLFFMSNYKFTIAFENESACNYLTEKIIHPFLVKSIPIYWGCPQVAEYYNPAAFINCHAYKSFSDVIEKVREIDKDPILYQHYLAAPAILPNSRFHSMIEEQKKYAKIILTTAMAKRRAKETKLLDTLRLKRLNYAYLPLAILGEKVLGLPKLRKKLLRFMFPPQLRI